MRKTTKIRFCQIPKRTNTTTLKKNGKPIHLDEILDVYTDIIKNPYLIDALEKEGIAKKVLIRGSDDKNVYVYTVSLKQFNLLNIPEIIISLKEHTNCETVEELNEIVTAVLGMQYILHSKTQFEVDIVVLEGNASEYTKEDIE